ncbi:MATE family efflux transporter [Treponema pectinovorum]|uniref:hypothetical protein n=1 Tax=Treponema pectinovorum TaxID=164 RepID=UPI001C9CB184|nr:hypothetical protein [Treponema pectinovorum]
MGLEYSFFSVGAIIMQSAINTLGTAVITGQTAGEKIRQLFTLFNNSVKHLSVISCFFIFHGSLMILRNTLQGMGYSIIALLSGVCEIIGRGIGSLLAIETLGFFGICLANPFAWILALLFCSLAVFHYLHLKLKQQS